MKKAKSRISAGSIFHMITLLNNRNVLLHFLAILFFIVICSLNTGYSQNKTIPGKLTVLYPTLINLAVEWEIQAMIPEWGGECQLQGKRKPRLEKGNAAVQGS
jgi:hypothetical protein